MTAFALPPDACEPDQFASRSVEFCLTAGGGAWTDARVTGRCVVGFGGGGMLVLVCSEPLAVIVLERLRGADFDEATAGRTSLFFETLDDIV